MSNTFKTKNYFKALRARNRGEDPEGISDYWDHHRFSFFKTPRDSKGFKLTVKTAGHRRRRAIERAVQAELRVRWEDTFHIDWEGLYDESICTSTVYNLYREELLEMHEALEPNYDYEAKLLKNAKKHSNIWDYY